MLRIVEVIDEGEGEEDEEARELREVSFRHT
jgi:hypothetical protein